MKRTLIKAVIFAAALIAGVLFLRNVFFVEMLRRGVAHHTGLDIHARAVNIDPFNLQVSIEGLRIYNPPGFAGKELAHLSKCNMVLCRDSLFEDTFRLKTLEIAFEELSVKKNAQGEVNLVRALGMLDAGEDKGPLHIERLRVEMDKVHYVNRVHEPPLEHTALLGIDAGYRNVSGYEDLVSNIFVKVFFSPEVRGAGPVVRALRDELIAFSRD